MTRIATISERAAQGELKALYAEIKAGMGTPNVPEVFRVMSQSPALLAAMWQLFRELMLTEKALPRATKELIAVVVSKANACRYCVTAHSIFLKALGYSGSQIEAQTARLDAADLDPATRALLDLAEKATLAPTRIADDEVQAVLAAGVSEPELLEAMLVVSFFNGINRLVDALGVEPDLLMEVGVRLPPVMASRIIKTSD